MHFFQAIIAPAISLTLFHSTAHAVGISFSQNADCSQPTLRCNNIPAQICCNNNHGLIDWYVKFTDYAHSHSTLLVAFTGGQAGCGTSCASRVGVDPQQPQGCFSCDDVNNERLRGAQWIFKSVDPLGSEATSSTRATEATPSGTTQPCRQPDMANIDGHWFHINYGIPQAHTDAIVDLAVSGASLQKVGEELLQWKVAEPVTEPNASSLGGHSEL
ncbi:uncharacterized protein K460DRAFT_355021 [Cucurbitaria berberidis CBS 394.84]|uniref:Secreted protein n=1 Tax=Cucurbitaria berberidis CBS 394.84 TaxID=1168544 RepID=A0A9P4GFM1_9PLEO|nr:uncharacterized protein K460DRAFT_355021 [Cucurbitaria berberidis CBS 394.84]KAF1845173.1 hypothetical protein K460DRAFT_355021 [Cucurbitaria berberidis CBS 394.84]